jgi:hypothetical protein
MLLSLLKFLREMSMLLSRYATKKMFLLCKDLGDDKALCRRLSCGLKPKVCRLLKQLRKFERGNFNFAA